MTTRPQDELTGEQRKRWLAALAEDERIILGQAKSEGTTLDSLDAWHFDIRSNLYLSWHFSNRRMRDLSSIAANIAKSNIGGDFRMFLLVAAIERDDSEHIAQRNAEWAEVSHE